MQIVGSTPALHRELENLRVFGSDSSRTVLAGLKVLRED